MDQCKPPRTPADLNLNFQTAQNGDEEVDQRIYRSLFGSLLYLGKQTRPDIMFTVNIPSIHMNAPTNQHCQCGKRLLQYLHGSKDLKLTHTKESSYDLVGESDADWSGDVKDRKSTTGYYFKLNGRGAALNWGVKKQATVTLSSSEAEYQGMAAAVQEALYLKQLLKDFGIQQKGPIAIGEDNQNCITLCKIQSCTRGASTSRQSFTPFGTRRKMGLFHFITFLQTKWQRTSSQSPYPFRKLKHSEQF